MPDPLIPLLRDWHDFYALIGTASATLVGLMFVAISLGVGVYSAERKTGLRTFVSPTVVHFSAILVTCIVISAPSHSWDSLGGLLLAGGCGGLAYSCAVFVVMGRGGLTATLDLEDRIWYALSPIAGYLLVTAAAMGLLLAKPESLELLALALVLLLMVAIRNAWDITVWVVLRPRGGQGER